ncbi:YgiT-type zinc finger protein [Brevibacillus fulvus]
MEKCPLCSGQIRIEYKNFSYNADGKAHTIPNIKYYVCSNCNERFLDEESSRKIDQFKEE